MKREQVKLVKIIICTLLLTCALGWVSSSRVLLPFFAGCEEQTVLEDTDHDGDPESYVLHNRSLSVYANDRLLWQSDEDWMVQSFVLADVNHDTIDDLLMVVWKRGSFGPAKPFWTSRDDRRFSHHLFMYNLRQGQIKPLWMSSALDRPIKSLRIADPDNDGKNELLVQDGSYSLWGWIKASAVSPAFQAWQWKGWGFYQLD
ncbi:MAG: hypothetical protein VB084_11285 [Syntrophomonadaceae bacterium]|nr:hypothetical protein [Syntrophomonadaceae bacterium]